MLFSDKEHSEETFKSNSMIALQEKGRENSEKSEGENSSLFNFLLLSFLFIVRNLYIQSICLVKNTHTNQKPRTFQAPKFDH